LSREVLITPPAPIRPSTLDNTVLGSERFGRGPAPATRASFDQSPPNGGHDDPDVLVCGEVESDERTGRHDGCVCSGDDENTPATVLTSPGSQAPIDPTIVRKIRDETRIVFAILLE